MDFFCWLCEYVSPYAHLKHGTEVNSVSLVQGNARILIIGQCNSCAFHSTGDVLERTDTDSSVRVLCFPLQKVWETFDGEPTVTWNGLGFQKNSSLCRVQLDKNIVGTVVVVCG